MPIGTRSYFQQRAVRKKNRGWRLETGDSGTYSRNVHSGICYDAVKNRSFDQPRGDFFAIQDGETDVWVLGGINFAEVDLAIFLTDEAGEICPVGSHFAFTCSGRFEESKLIEKVLYIE